MYSKKVIKHFQNPKNQGKLKDPDGVGKVGNVVCGDMMHIYVKIGDGDGNETRISKGNGNQRKKEVIEDIKFETFGCTAAIATSSMLTELAKGKTIDEALEIKGEDVIEGLGNLPPIKTHCSLLAVDGLKQAIYDYLKKNNREIPEELEKRHKLLEKQNKMIEEKYS